MKCKPKGNFVDKKISIMASEVIVALVGLFCTTVSSIVTFILTKRKYNSEVDSQQLQNTREAFEIYKTTMEESLAAQKKRLEDTIASQNEKLDYLQRENDSLRNQVNQLQMQIIKYLGTNTLEGKEPKKEPKK